MSNNNETHCDTLQYTATHCNNTLQHTATRGGPSPHCKPQATITLRGSAASPLRCHRKSQAPLHVVWFDSSWAVHDITHWLEDTDIRWMKHLAQHTHSKWHRKHVSIIIIIKSVSYWQIESKNETQDICSPLAPHEWRHHDAFTLQKWNADLEHVWH